MTGTESKENGLPGGKVLKAPKKICGNKPFKIPSMGVLQDVVNEALY
jgi:hypothetical protein